MASSNCFKVDLFFLNVKDKEIFRCVAPKKNRDKVSIKVPWTQPHSTLPTLVIESRCVVSIAEIGFSLLCFSCREQYHLRGCGPLHISDFLETRGWCGGWSWKVANTPKPLCGNFKSYNKLCTIGKPRPVQTTSNRINSKPNTRSSSQRVAE